MTFSKTWQGGNACGAARTIQLLRDGGRAWVWLIFRPDTMQVVMSSRSMPAPGYGFYATEKDALRSARRVLKTLAQ